MKEKLLEFLRIPPEIRSVFWQDILQKNRLSLLVICVMIFGMELFNMARVLFWSSAGLGTLNNRIYFGFYCTLFLSAVLCLLLGFLLRGRSLRCRLAVQYGGVLFFLLWHVCLNAYDLFRDPQAEIGLYYTAVLGLSVFILMPAAPALLMHGSAYALLMALSGRILSGGDRVNITCTAIVALAMSLTNAHHHELNVLNGLVKVLHDVVQTLGNLDRTITHRTSNVKGKNHRLGVGMLVRIAALSPHVLGVKHCINAARLEHVLCGIITNDTASRSVVRITSRSRIACKALCSPATATHV